MEEFRTGLHACFCRSTGCHHSICLYIDLARRSLTYPAHTVVRVIWGQFFTCHLSSKIWKQKFFYFLKPILSPPYLGPYIYRWFHAKFQDSRTNNKKRPPHSDAKRPLAVYTTVWQLEHILCFWNENEILQTKTKHKS